MSSGPVNPGSVNPELLGIKQALVNGGETMQYTKTGLLKVWGVPPVGSVGVLQGECGSRQEKINRKSNCGQ